LAAKKFLIFYKKYAWGIDKIHQKVKEKSCLKRRTGMWADLTAHGIIQPGFTLSSTPTNIRAAQAVRIRKISTLQPQKTPQYAKNGAADVFVAAGAEVMRLFF
jgi:hypothetical protein